jgi:quercetin dioxygenase-like cupin family protein
MTQSTALAAKKGHKHIAGRLNEPVLSFNLADEIAELHKEQAWSRTGRVSKTLVKYTDLRIVLIVLGPNVEMEKHSADARISIQTLKGSIRLRLPDDTITLSAGRLLAIDRGIEHNVEALVESALLLTLSWPRG